MTIYKKIVGIFIFIIFVTFLWYSNSCAEKTSSECKDDVVKFEIKLISIDKDFNESYSKLTKLSAQIKTNRSKIVEFKKTLEECNVKAKNAHFSIYHINFSEELPGELLKYMDVARIKLAACYFARMKFTENILNSINGIREQYSTNEKLLQESAMFLTQGGLALAQAKLMVGLN